MFEAVSVESASGSVWRRGLLGPGFADEVLAGDVVAVGFSGGRGTCVASFAATGAAGVISRLFTTSLISGTVDA